LRSGSIHLVQPIVMKRLLREPLLHFLLIGAGLFLLYGLLNRGQSDAPREIVISEARVEALAENFATVWMRPPTAAELKGLIDDYVAEEVYYREAVAMGLDQDDTVIRRRLRQKMEFISEDVAAATEPTDAQLQAYLEQHADKFVLPATLTFQQAYLSVERRGETARADAEKLLADLQAGRGPADPAEAGDATLLPATMEAASPQAIANAFGEEFARQIDEAPVGQWSGPIESGFGLHLVKVDERVAASAPSLAEIRPIVLREWQSEQRRTLSESFLDTLRSKYEVRVEGAAAGLFAAPAASGAAQ
jgi:parvulin-like peptidyl-prolyl isomerase